MAKQAVKVIKIQIEAGKATPAPPVGTVLGPAGINLQEFCTKYNDATRDRMGDIIPVEISIYEDRTFDFVLKTPPTASLLMKAANLKKGSVKGANEIVATITKDDLRKIAEVKMPDLNAYDIDSAMNIVAGTARNMGIAIKGLNDTELAEQAKEAVEAAQKAAELEAEFAEMEEEAKTEVNVEVETTEQGQKDEENKEE
ncbi:MAG: 50S ribosomal protein L11 [Bacilli bacterium]|nr:50S ribosomal protein L11 [Bacilli bacterium]